MSIRWRLGNQKVCLQGARGVKNADDLYLAWPFALLRTGLGQNFPAK